MAQKIQTLFIDDIDGGEADGTVRFSLDGTEYEIDLNARHTDELRSALKSYIEHSRKVQRPGGRPRAAAAAGPARLTPGPSGPGRGSTATTSRTAAASRRTSSPSTRKPSGNRGAAPGDRPGCPRP